MQTTKYTAATRRAISNYGAPACSRAFELSQSGEGAASIATAHFLPTGNGLAVVQTTNQADAAINAGREIAEAGKPTAATKRKHVSPLFSATQAESRIILQIAHRAIASLYHATNVTPLDIQMDIDACHSNGCKLRLAELLAADDFNFSHDVRGIHNCLDRDTGKLIPPFSPRYSAPKPTAANHSEQMSNAIWGGGAPGRVR